MTKQNLQNIPNIEEIAIAALLHDIGKFYQRACGSTENMPQEVLNRASIILPTFDGRSSHWHALWSDSFFEEYVDKHPFPKNLDRKKIRDCAVFHHAPDKAENMPTLQTSAFSWIITEADRIASGMERKEKDIDGDSDPSGVGRDKYRKTCLANIFSKVTDIVEKDAVKYKFQKLGTFLTDDFVPALDVGTDAQMPSLYDDLWEEFAKEYVQMAQKCHSKTELFYDGIIGLLEKYTWAIPSSTIDEPDVSLYDHAMAASAVAACLFAHHEFKNNFDDLDAIKNRETPKLRFIIGDLSGIQKSLFTLASEGARGLPKLLRGRSLRMQLIVQTAAKRILKTLNLPPTCILQNAGGRFVILAPFTDNDKQNALIDELRQEFDEFLRDQYHGDLILNISLSEPFNAADLIDNNKSTKTLSIISHTAEVAKLNPLRGARSAKWEQKWDTQLGICRSCGKRPAFIEDKRANRHQCKACSAETKIGAAYPKAQAIIIDKSNEFNASDKLYGFNIGLPNSIEGVTTVSGWQFNYDKTKNFPFGKKYTRAYVPVHNKASINDEKLQKIRLENGEDAPEAGDLLTFEEIAAQAKGVKLLAAFKADVDRLGQVFSRGLGKNKSLARVASLSRMMDVFFNGKLPAILESDFPNIYTVYAGGDDLLLVGAWNEVLKLATRINYDFAAHVGNNPNITISAGISLFSPNTPITRAAEEAEERLEKAKSDGRNRIHVFNKSDEDALTWAEFDKIMNDGEKLDEYKVSNSLLHKLLVIDNMRQRSKTNPNYADWKAKLGYLLWRLYPDKGEKKNNNQEIRKFILDLMGVSLDLKNANEKSVRAAIAYAIYLNR